MPISDAQKSILLTYFNNGMVGVGKKYIRKIDAVVAETGLTERQVKVKNIYIFLQKNVESLSTL